MWEPSPITDFDVCLFARRRDRQVGTLLTELRQQLIVEMEAKGIDFDLRIVRVPYKRPLFLPEKRRCTNSCTAGAA